MIHLKYMYIYILSETLRFIFVTKVVFMKKCYKQNAFLHQEHLPIGASSQSAHFICEGWFHLLKNAYELK